MKKNKKVGVGIIIINQNGEFLLHLRDGNTPLMTNQWSLVGGGIEPGELPENAAEREVFEETSLVASDVVSIGSLAFNEDWDALIFQARVNTLKDKIKLGEGKQLKFFSQENVKTLLEEIDYTNPFLDFLKNYINEFVFDV